MNTVDCTSFTAALEALRSGAPGADVSGRLRDHARACPACAVTFAPYASAMCSQITDFLADYLDGELEAEALGVFEFHLSVCPECRRYLRSYELTRRLARDSAAPDARPPQRLVDAILAARRAPPGS